jgi:hypothetical protein
MATGFSAVIILILITLAIASVGLVLFILGLILKKPGQWIPGIVLTGVSVILGIYSLILVVNMSENRSDSYSGSFGNPNIERDYSSPYDDNNDAQAVPDEKSKMETDENSSRISGFIQDDDKSLIYIKVFPSADLYDMGIKITKIDSYSNSARKQKMIPLEINFANKFKGNLQLILLSSSEEEMGRSSVQVNQNGNTTFTVKFVFDKTANFLQTDHARLKSSD